MKSGYALSHAGELRLLGPRPGALGQLGPLASSRPTSGRTPSRPGPPDRAERYVDEIVLETLPVIARRRLAAFCDVFCEPASSPSRRHERLLCAAPALGLGTKIHADEFELSGGARLAAELEARSAEHLLATALGATARRSRGPA